MKHSDDGGPSVLEYQPPDQGCGGKWSKSRSNDTNARIVTKLRMCITNGRIKFVRRSFIIILQYIGGGLIHVRMR